jgi:N,N-dimethylformamidase beta subunit-like protein
MDQSSQSITKVPSSIRGLCASHLWRALALLLFVCACFAFWGAVQPSSLNKIQRENRQPGTTAWQLTNPAENRQIENYASLTSVPVGGDIDLFVNTHDATYTLTVFRMGWYGGKGGRKVLGPQTLPGIQQPIPTADPRTELIECNWTSPFHIHVPASWVSGIYLAKLHGKTSGKESYIIFCVRDSRRADLVFQQSVTTYQAYNGWLGQSLHTFNTAGETQVDRVSFNRPYAAGNPGQGAGAGDFLGTIAPVAIEYSMVRWLEREGYDVTYITNVDTHEAVGRLLRGKGFLSVGHDEYWSHNMKAHIIQACDQGVGLGFLSANYAFWPIDLEPSSSGAPSRTISVALDNRCFDGDTNQSSTRVCSADSDCSAGETCKIKTCNFTCLVDSNGLSQTEQTLVGGMWDPGHLIDARYGGDIVVTEDVAPKLDHWVFANTGLKVGDVLPGLIGVEWNSTRDDYPKPAGLQVLLHTQVPHFQWPGETSGGYAFGSDLDFDGWYQAFEASGRQLDPVCHHERIGPHNLAPSEPFCSNPWPDWPDTRYDWGMTIYQASSGAWVFNAATMEWGGGLDDYFTGIQANDGVNNGPAVRTQCGYPWFHPDLGSCRSPTIEQITRNVLNKFINP